MYGQPVHNLVPLPISLNTFADPSSSRRPARAIHPATYPPFSHPTRWQQQPNMPPAPAFPVLESAFFWPPQTVSYSAPYTLQYPMDQLSPFPDYDQVSPSPSDSCSSVWSATTPPCGTPEPVHIVCAVPLQAPKPLPYHSPKFLQFEELPEEDEDLSHPPYTRRPPKRRRAASPAHDDDVLPIAKRRLISLPGTSTRQRSSRPR